MTGVGEQIAPMTCTRSILPPGFTRRLGLVWLAVLLAAAGCDRNPTEASPGRWIAFKSAFPSNRFHVTREDGSGERQLEVVPAGATGLAWSSDGESIAFTFIHVGKNAIFIAAEDGPVTRIISGPPPSIPVDSFVGYVAPAWSPDGRRIAFGASRLGRHELMIINADGTGLTRIGGEAGISFFTPAWSPDGARIAVSTNVTGGEYSIHTMNPDGTAITSLGVNGGSPSWSPDGARIAYQARIDNNTDIYAMNADGSGVTRLTDHAETDFDPAWSPDGTTLAFASTRLTVSLIFTMNADGSGVTRLPTQLFNNFEPVWRP